MKANKQNSDPSATTPQLAEMPFRVSISRWQEQAPEQWCKDSGIGFKMVKGEALEESLACFASDEFHFSTEEEMIKFNTRFPGRMAWVETAGGRHLPLPSIPPWEHRPDRIRRERRNPLRKASAGWDPNRTLSWKQRARMSNEAASKINTMVQMYYRTSPPSTLRKVSGMNEGPLFLLDFLGQRFLIFVQVMLPRIAPDWNMIPGILGEAAERYKASPAVVFVDPDRKYRTAGFAALEARLKSIPQWRQFLLYGREPADFLKMRGAHLSHVEFHANIRCTEDFWHRPDRLVEAELLLDGERINALSLSTADLLRSLAYPDRRELLNCSCGHSGCAEIKLGCITCEHDGIMLIKLYSAKRPRLLLFDAEQYRKSAISCLSRLVEIKHIPGTETTWTLVNPQYLKTLSLELNIALNHEY
jgi:hypothetical protein